MAITQTSDTASIIEKRVSSITTETLIQEAVAIPTVKNFSVESGMDTLKVPLFNELAIQDVLEAGDMTAQTITLATADLVLNRHKSIPFAISDRAGLQSKANLIDQTVRNGARTLAAEVDDHIFSLIDAGAASRNALTVGDPLADLALAKKIMDEDNVPKFGRVVAASPAFIQALLTSNNVINADKYGSSAPVQAGFVTKVYGFTIVESSSASIVEDGFQAYHMDAVGFARQMNVKFERERKVLGQRWEYAMTHLYGAITLDPSGKRMVVFDADGI